MTRVTLRGRTIYRAKFWLGLVFNFIRITGELAVILLLVSRVHGIIGWTSRQVMLRYGLSAAAAGVYRVFLSELNDFDRYLVHGEFDAILMRPVHTWATVVSRSVDLDQVGWIVEGVAIMAVSGSLLDFGLTPAWPRRWSSGSGWWWAAWCGWRWSRRWRRSAFSPPASMICSRWCCTAPRPPRRFR